MIAANAIAPSFPPKPTNASCKRRIKIPNKNPDNAIQLIFMILAEVMPTKVDPINTYGILSERSWFSFKTSGLFLMYDTFPRSRNEFKRETEKF
jgi:hypothetical protein